MFSLSHYRHRQTPYLEINSPLPRLDRYIGTPLAGGVDITRQDKERFLTALSLEIMKLAIS